MGFFPQAINLSNCFKTSLAKFRDSFLPFGVATPHYLVVWMLDAFQHCIVALPIQWGWSSKRKAFQAVFISKINQILILLVYLCVFVFIDLALQSHS